MNESALYSLIFRSKLELAKAFKRWVTKNVLPSIRKTGRYDYCINHKYNNTLTFKIENETDLQVKVVSFLKKRYPHSLFTVTLGENQATVHKRINSFKKGYLRGFPNLIIKNLNQALKGHTKSYDIELQDNLNPLNHFTKTKALVESHLQNLLKDMKGFKFIETLEVTFEKDTINSKTGKRVSIYKTAFFNGKAKTITKPNDIEPELNMSRQEILNVIDKWVSEGLGWVIDRIDSHYINVTTYKPLHGSSYIELPTELRNPKKGLINIKNKDDECFRWCHIRNLSPQEKILRELRKRTRR